MTPRYRVERVLDRGRHAGIWLATDLERQGSVALKIAARGGDLWHEFSTLRAVGSDHAVQTNDCGVLPDGRPYLAMEYLERGSAAQAHLPRSIVAQQLFSAAQALAGVHRKGWVHRDLKPAHLLLRQTGTVVLCDFGSACRAGTPAQRAAPSVIGTPRYAAPEQIAGASACPTADVYSLGVCAFELLAGKPPFPGETLTELFSQHLRAPVPRLPREAAHWQELVDALLAKAPAQRPADGDAVLKRLAPLMGEAT